MYQGGRGWAIAPAPTLPARVKGISLNTLFQDFPETFKTSFSEHPLENV